MLTTIFGFLMCACFVVGFIPQAYKMWRNKSSADVSSWQYVLTIGGYVSAMIYMFLTGFGWWFFLNYFLGIAFCLLIIYLCQKYKQKP